MSLRQTLLGRKVYTLFLFTLFLSLTVFSQKLKNKDVKKLLTDAKVTAISIVAEDKFTPERKMEADLQVTFQGGYNGTRV